MGAAVACVPAAWMVFDFKLMYAFFQEKGLKATPAGRSIVRQGYSGTRSVDSKTSRWRRRGCGRRERGCTVVAGRN